MHLTQSQTLIWTGQKLHPEVPLYNMILAFSLHGPVNPAWFRQAFQHLVDRSDALRTVIGEVDGMPYQQVIHEFIYELPLYDFSQRENPEAAIQAWIEQHKVCVFDLAASLFDSALLKVAEDRFVWYLNQHHLITDGWTVTLMFQYMAQLYERISREQSVLDVVLPSYQHYVEYERAFRDRPRFESIQDYWRQKMAAFNPGRLSLYGYTGRPGQRTTRVSCRLGRERSDRLRAIAQQKEIRSLTLDLSLFNVFLTVLSTYLYKVSGNIQIAIGAPAHNRPTRAFKQTIGLFIELFPLHLELDSDPTLLSLLNQVRTESGSFLRYAQPGAGTAELQKSFNVVLNYINATVSDFPGASVHSEWIHAGYGDRSHHLRLQVQDWDDSGEFRLDFDLNVDVVPESRHERIVTHFLNVLDAFIADPAQPLSRIDVLTEAERRELVTFNTTQTPYPSDQTVVDLFETQAGRTPEAVAVLCGQTSLTYQMLDRRSNQLAHYLRKQQVDTGSRVGIYLKRSPDFLVAVLGVLKAGGVYIPIDASYPAHRVAFMLEDAKSDLLLTQSDLAESLPELQTSVVVLDSLDKNLKHEPFEFAEDHASPDDLAYIIYTSGSTGRPKGVMVPHRALVNYLRWAREQYVGDSYPTFPLFTSVSFDLTVTSIFVPLISGGTVAVYPEHGQRIDLTLLNVLEDDISGVVKLTPSHLEMVKHRRLEHTRIRRLIVGGEDFKRSLAEAVFDAFGRNVEIYNEYGPTEATVGCTVHRFDPELHPGSSVPIGKPIANVQVYVLDEHLRPVPQGVIGELYIAGAGLADGYWNRPDLTHERFVLDAEGRYLYRTGDLVRFNNTDTLDYLGRKDQQLKVRGARIELAEIEAALNAYDGIATSVVTLRRSGSDALTYCSRCGLPSNYPGAMFDEGEVCHLCRAFDSYQEQAGQYFKSTEELRALLKQADSRADYDCMMLLSGGKDSTYALCRLVDMGLKVLAFTLDNGYISDEAKANINRVVRHLDVEHVYGQTPAMNAIFVDSLKRYSNVCNGCFKTLYTLSMNLACEKGIPYIVTGLSRGQFFETRLTEELFQNETVDVDRIDLTILEARKAYHRVNDAVHQLLDVGLFEDDLIFEQIQFVDFYRYVDVSLDDMMNYLGVHVPWIRPSDTGRSTNCLINDAGIHIHKRERGYHNYAFPYSWDVRMGHKTREAALAELNDDIDEARIHGILTEIGYEPRNAAPEAARESLIAYYVAPASIADAELRKYMSEKVPAFMIPAHFVRLENIPLTPNGKVDRDALPEVTQAVLVSTASYEAPRTAIEQVLADIWAEVLHVPRIGIHDAFLDLGGHSLAAIQIMARINEAFYIDLSIHHAFEASTIAQLAELVEAAFIAEIEALSDEEAVRLVQQMGGEDATP